MQNVMNLVDSVAPAEGFPYRGLVLPYLPLKLETLINEAARQREREEAAASGALPVPVYTTWEVVNWVAMMASGLAFLRYTCRISHGDLAPRNVPIAGAPNKAGVVSGDLHTRPAFCSPGRYPATVSYGASHFSLSS
jgi:hypothetical protein